MYAPEHDAKNPNTPASEQYRQNTTGIMINNNSHSKLKSSVRHSSHLRNMEYNLLKNSRPLSRDSQLEEKLLETFQETERLKAELTASDRERFLLHQELTKAKEDAMNWTEARKKAAATAKETQLLEELYSLRMKDLGDLQNKLGKAENRIRYEYEDSRDRYYRENTEFFPEKNNWRGSNSLYNSQYKSKIDRTCSVTESSLEVQELMKQNQKLTGIIEVMVVGKKSRQQHQQHDDQHTVQDVLTDRSRNSDEVSTGGQPSQLDKKKDIMITTSPENINSVVSDFAKPSPSNLAQELASAVAQCHELEKERDDWRNKYLALDHYLKQCNKLEDIVNNASTNTNLLKQFIVDICDKNKVTPQDSSAAAVNSDKGLAKTTEILSKLEQAYSDIQTWNGVTVEKVNDTDNEITKNETVVVAKKIESEGEQQQHHNPEDLRSQLQTLIENNNGKIFDESSNIAEIQKKVFSAFSNTVNPNTEAIGKIKDSIIEDLEGLKQRLGSVETKVKSLLENACDKIDDLQHAIESFAKNINEQEAIIQHQLLHRKPSLTINLNQNEDNEETENKQLRTADQREREPASEKFYSMFAHQTEKRDISDTKSLQDITSQFAEYTPRKDDKSPMDRMSHSPITPFENSFKKSVEAYHQQNESASFNRISEDNLTEEVRASMLNESHKLSEKIAAVTKKLKKTPTFIYQFSEIIGDFAINAYELIKFMDKKKAKETCDDLKKTAREMQETCKQYKQSVKGKNYHQFEETYDLFILTLNKILTYYEKLKHTKAKFYQSPN
jgi:hypothetical protein